MSTPLTSPLTRPFAVAPASGNHPVRRVDMFPTGNLRIAITPLRSPSLCVVSACTPEGLAPQVARHGTTFSSYGSHS